MSSEFLSPWQSQNDGKRMFLAVGLMTLCLMLFNWYTEKEVKPVAEKPAETEKQVQDIPKIEVPENISAEETLFGATQAPQEEAILVFRDPQKDLVKRDFEVRLSNYGGHVTQVTLLSYVPAVHLIGLDDESMFLSLQSTEPGLAATSPYEVLEKTPTRVRYGRMMPTGIYVTRLWEMDAKGQLRQQLTFHNQALVPQALDVSFAVASPFKPKTPQAGFFTPATPDVTGVCHQGQERFVFSKKDLETAQKTQNGTPTYVGFDETYFLAVLAWPRELLADKCQAKVATTEKDGLKWEQIRLEVPAKITLNPQEQKTFTFDVYLGSKQLDALRAFGHEVDQNVNLGWFGAIARPLLWVLLWIFDWVKNFGLAIILLTLLIKLVTYPLTKKSFLSMQSMKTLAPKLKDIQAKYGHDRVLLGQKQMELYQQAGINPMAGCLPLLLQMPVWFALYQMLGNSVELYQQPFYGWILDLTTPDPYYVMPILMGLSMAVLQYFQPAPEDNPQMKYMMWGMPFFLTFVMLNMPAGLSLYMVVNNLITIVQQVYLKKRTAYVL